MQFNSPLPRGIQPRYSEGSGLASNRDGRNNSQIWKKQEANTNQDVRNGQAVQKLQRDVSKIRRVRMGMPTVQQTLEFYPFRIYNVPVTKAILAAVHAVDPSATVAPWQCWQVRMGLAAGRSQYVLDTGDYGDYYAYGEERKYVLTGSDGNLQSQSTNIATNPLNTNSIVLIDDTSVAVCPANTTATWILNSKVLDAFLATNYGFWIELTDDPVLGFTPQIKAQRWTFDVSTPTSHFPYPIASNVIPIGKLMALDGDFEYQDFEPTSPFNLSNVQELYSHAVNRYPTSSGGISMTHYLGNWDDDSLNGRVFWPGDYFQYDRALPKPNIFLLNYVGTPKVFTSADPPTDPDMQIVWTNNF